MPWPVPPGRDRIGWYWCFFLVPLLVPSPLKYAFLLGFYGPKHLTGGQGVAGSNPVAPIFSPAREKIEQENGESR